ncbi:MAG: Ig-like domain-containing protein, partial [Planctomycetota bacterium]|nr:Ig-like domain-containing protein [Planctomycetota bacterium]
MSNSPIPKFSLLAILVITALPGCFQSSVDSSGGANSIGPFEVETVNLQEDDVWALNRPIVLTFNHPLDPDSIDLTTVMIRPLSPEVTGNPVTGSFEIMAGSDDRTLIFRPRCPTDADNSNGAFVPGGYEYELTLPTNATFGASTLRDTAGHSLSVGLTRHFFSPAPPVETLFIDTVTGPPLLDSVTPMTVPSGLNLFSNPDPIVAIHFNQPIDASPDNLNTSRLTLYYSEGEVGDTGELDFPAMNTLPGELLLYQNCSTTGATVYFQVAGIMPPNRNLQLVVSPLFQDIAGEFNSQPQVTIPEATPSLTDYYVNGPLFDESGGNLETVDEFQDFFLDSSWIADDPLLEFPAADWEIGSVTASFSYTGEQVSSDEDFILSSFQDLELLTDGEFFFDDSSGRPFSMTDGVLYVDDFTIEADALLRGKGSNPLIIYATGTVTVLGTLDVSGENAASPPAITNPLIPELGALGHCGGGDGGSASSSTTSETPRAASGGGAFGIGLGGGGGESSVSWESTDMATYSVDPEGKIAGGGAGGTFALTPPSAITWERWTAETNPLTFDDAGPDIRFDRHTVFQDGLGGYDMTEIAAFFIGGEHGMRGNAWRDANTTEPPSTMGIPGQYGGYGMEEVSRDMDANDKTDGLDPSWTTNPPSGGGAPPYNFGHPTDGPDAGFTNTSVLGSTSSTSDDFWGTRYNGFGTAVATLGELTAPWAGAGGGGSGDSSIVNRIDADADSFLDPFSDFFPDTSFPSGWTKEYYKGAAGGGG